MARFTAANASEMAARSVAVRKAAEAKRTACPASIPLQATPPADTALGISVACVRARLATLDGLLAKAKTDREWDNLSRSYERLFKVWCVLSNTPGPPGSRRPGREDPRRQRRAPESIFVDEQPPDPDHTRPESLILEPVEPPPSLPVEPPNPAPIAPPTQLPASIVGPVPLAVALLQRPAPLPAPAPPAPPCQKPG